MMPNVIWGNLFLRNVIYYYKNICRNSLRGFLSFFTHNRFRFRGGGDLTVRPYILRSTLVSPPRFIIVGLPYISCAKGKYLLSLFCLPFWHSYNNNNIGVRETWATLGFAPPHYLILFCLFFFCWFFFFFFNLHFCFIIDGHPGPHFRKIIS